MSSRNAARIAGWAAVGVLTAAAVGAGVAYAADPSPSATETPGPAATSGGGGGADQHGLGGRHRARLGRVGAGLGLAGRAMHGELVVKDKNGAPMTVDVQQGDVTAVSASSVTLKSDDGFTATYTITADTRVRINEKGATTAAVKTGDTAVVTARKDGSSKNAQVLVVRQK